VGYLGITLNEMEKNTVELDKMTEIWIRNGSFQGG
jgi:hypothetical protein